jgi:hypothetical protein
VGRGPSQRIEIVVPLRTMVQIAAFRLVVVLAILSLGTLISIFLAAVLALGIDPLLGVVGAILAVPFAAVIKTFANEAGRPRRERMAELRTEELPVVEGEPEPVAKG